MRLTYLLAVQALGGLLAEAYILPASRRQNASASSSPDQKRQKKRSIGKRGDDPSDYSWVKRWAAVGDSYTAGIGSGSPLGNQVSGQPRSNAECARYDLSWPVIVNDALGSSVEDFFFYGCSGDRTGGVYNQIKALDGDLDLVMLTAGGNDLCLAKLIEKCVFAPSGDSSCEDVISIAQTNLASILKDNIQQLMDALDEKMNDDGVVVYSGYAQFFNTETEDCANQDWAYVTLWPGNSGLTVDRRTTFNNLVLGINKVIKEVVDAAASNSNYKWKIGYSNWDPWVYDGVRGQMCDPDGTGDYPDPEQPDLQFFKPDTNPADDGIELRRRWSGDTAAAAVEDEKRWATAQGAANVTAVAADDARAKVHGDDTRRSFREDLYKSILFHSVNPGAEVKHRLDSRSPSPPGCPGDTDADVQPRSIGLPVSVSKNFHPNELGHYTIASFALQTMVDTRAAVLDLDVPACVVQNKFTCWQSQGSKAYASADRLNEDYKDFCAAASGKASSSGWSYQSTYHQGTPDETLFLVSLSASSGTLSQAECLERMSDIINNCDGNDPNNPMNWKFGGEYDYGDYVYQVNPQKSGRHWPVPTSAGGDCKGKYKFLFSSYTLHGYGWSTYDFGQKTLMPEAKSCIGGGLTSWDFEYFDEADDDGNEWKATFRTPIWVRKRCFKNNKVQSAAGGYTDGCSGND